ncbi:MAG: hypothetical protein CMJ46_15625 [Planctomyces sp.]|nr:hypothetical protein [Planctomyces sp.]
MNTSLRTILAMVMGVVLSGFTVTAHAQDYGDYFDYYDIDIDGDPRIYDDDLGDVADWRRDDAVPDGPDVDVVRAEENRLENDGYFDPDADNEYFDDEYGDEYFDREYYGDDYLDEGYFNDDSYGPDYLGDDIDDGPDPYKGFETRPEYLEPDPLDRVYPDSRYIPGPEAGVYLQDNYYDGPDALSEYNDAPWDNEYDIGDGGLVEPSYYDDDYFYDYYDKGWNW